MASKLKEKETQRIQRIKDEITERIKETRRRIRAPTLERLYIPLEEGYGRGGGQGFYDAQEDFKRLRSGLSNRPEPLRRLA